MQRRYKIGAELPEYDAPCALADGWAALPDADIPATDGDTVVVADCTMQGALARKGGSCAAAAKVKSVATIASLVPDIPGKQPSGSWAIGGINKTEVLNANTDRMRAVKIPLASGNVVGLDRGYNTYHFAVQPWGTDSGIDWIKDGDNSYWTRDFTVPNDGDYAFLVKKMNGTVADDHPAQADVDYLNAHFVIKVSHRILHASMDDTRSVFSDLSAHADTYDSIFDNPLLGSLKSLHDSYGMTMSMYTYNASVAVIPDKFKSDWQANAAWLKIGFHSSAFGNTLEDDDPNDVSDKYRKFCETLIARCGTGNVIDRCPRLESFRASLGVVQSLRDADYGIVGLLSPEEANPDANMSDRDSYYLPDRARQVLRTRGHYVDAAENVEFYNTDIRLDWLQSKADYDAVYPGSGGSAKVLLEQWVADATRSDKMCELEVFWHEWKWTDQAALITQLTEICEFAKNNKYDFGFAQDCIVPPSTNLCPTDFSAWESGDYAWQTGEKVEDAKKIRLIELIPVQGGCTYVCDTHGPQNINNTKDSVVFTIRTYDADKVYLETITTAPYLPQCTVAASANTVYFGVAMGAIRSAGGQTGEYPYSWWQEQFAAGAIHPEIRPQTAEETAALDEIETHTFNQAAEAQKQITGE